MSHTRKLKLSQCVIALLLLPAVRCSSRGFVVRHERIFERRVANQRGDQPRPQSQPTNQSVAAAMSHPPPPPVQPAMQYPPPPATTPPGAPMTAAAAAAPSAPANGPAPDSAVSAAAAPPARLFYGSLEGTLRAQGASAAAAAAQPSPPPAAAAATGPRAPVSFNNRTALLSTQLHAHDAATATNKVSQPGTVSMMLDLLVHLLPLPCQHLIVRSSSSVPSLCRCVCAGRERVRPSGHGVRQHQCVRRIGRHIRTERSDATGHGGTVGADARDGDRQARAIGGRADER